MCSDLITSEQLLDYMWSFLQHPRTVYTDLNGLWLVRTFGDSV